MPAYKAVFTETPKHIPTNRVVDEPLIGNGDTGVVLRFALYYGLLQQK
ncbi:hypothetical protein [Paenibacillus germinis]|nr:hypothetical protein [Paenibacillus germinis]